MFAKKIFEEKGRYTLASNNNTNWETSAVLSYYKTIGDHLLNAILGANLSERKYESTSFAGIGFTHDRLEVTLTGPLSMI